MSKAGRKHGSQNGISIPESFKMNIAMQSEVPWGSLHKILLVLLCTYGSIYCFAESFELELRSGQIAAFCICVTVLFEILLQLIKQRALAFLISILSAFAVIVYYSELIDEGFGIVRNAFAVMAGDYYGVDIARHAVTVDYDEAMTAVFCTIAFILILSVMTAVTVNGAKLLALIPSLIFVASGFLVGVIPPALPMLSYLIYVLMFLAMENVPSEIRAGKDGRNKQYRFYRDNMRMKPAIVVAMIFVICLLAARLILPESVYDNKLNLQEKKHAIQDYMNSISLEDIGTDLSDWVKSTFNIDKNLFEFVGSDSSVGGLDGGMLSNDGKVEFTNQIKLTAVLPRVKANVYLRGFTGVHYEEDCWAGMTRDAEKEYSKILKDYGSEKLTAVNMPAEFYSKLMEAPELLTDLEALPDTIIESTISIEYINDTKKFLYVPYDIDSTSVEDAKEKQDYYLNASSKNDTYGGKYYFSFDILGDWLENNAETVSENWSEFSNFEHAYREFVYDIYTKPPTKDLTEVEMIAEVIGGGLGSGASVLEYAEAVRIYLENHCEYSLEPGAIPDGEDYVEYFLTQNKKGYCAHFASTSVLLLRYMGIPARYVEGYIVPARAIATGKFGSNNKIAAIDSKGFVYGGDIETSTVEIRDNSAHAWVEVYLDGYGWYPVEMTAGYQSTTSGSTSGRPTVTPTEMPSTPTPTAIPDELTPTPTSGAKPGAASTPTPIPTPGLTQSPASGEQYGTGEDTSDTISSTLRILVIALLSAAVILALILLQAHMRAYLWNTRLSSKKRNAKLIMMYREIIRMLIRRISDAGDERSTEDISMLKRVHETEPEPEETVEQRALAVQEMLVRRGIDVEEMSFTELIKLVLEAAFGSGRMENEAEVRVRLYMRCVCKDMTKQSKGLKKIVRNLYYGKK